MTSSNNQFSDLIPDYYQGVIDPELKRLFEQELAKNPSLQKELEEFGEFAKLYSSIDSELPEPSAEIFDKIMNSIDTVERQSPVDPASQSRYRQVEIRPSLGGKLKELWSWLKGSTSLPWGVAVVQAIALVIFLMPAPQKDNYSTLSETPSLQIAKNQTPYNVVFKPSATESDIRQLLLDVKGSIIAGPTAEGRYILAMPAPDNPEQVRKTLMEHDAVMFVEQFVQ